MDQQTQEYRISDWKPNIGFYDDAKGAIYIATETGNMLFSNIMKWAH